MNISEAKRLLTALEDQFKLHPALPLDQQIEARFSSSLFGKGVVDRSSFSGRVSHWLNLSHTRQEQLGRIKKVLAQAFELIQQNPVEVQEYSFPFRIKLYQELSEELHKDTVPTEDELRLTPHIPQIASAINVSKAAEESRRKIQSLLRDLTVYQCPNLTIEEYLATFNCETPEAQFEMWKKILQNRPGINPQILQQRFDMLQKALQFNQLINDAFKAGGAPLDLPQRMKTIDFFANMASVAVHDLQSGNKWMFAGGYGIKMLSWDAIFKLMKKIPDEQQKSLPSFIQSVLSQNTPPNPQDLARNLVAKSLNELRDHLPPTQGATDLSGLHPLFQDETRQLSEGLAHLLPQYLQEPLNARLQQGVLGNTASILSLIPSDQIHEVMQFLLNHRDLYQGWGTPIDSLPLGTLASLLFLLPGSNAGQLMQWAAEYGSVIENEEQREVFFKKLEVKIFEYIGGNSDNILKLVNQQLMGIIKNSQNMISPEILKIFGLDQLTSGNFWIEFERQANGNFTVLVYGSGTAFHHHDKDNAGKVHWPLRLTDVAPERLSLDFFNRLLYHHMEPSLNANAISRAEDLYEGLLVSLKGKSQHQLPVEQASLDSEEELTGAFLIGAGMHVNQILFESDLFYFTSFYKPYLKGPQGKLEIPNQEVAHALDRGLEILKKRTKKIQSCLNEGEMIRLKATFEEVQAALDDFHTRPQGVEVNGGNNPLNLPQAVIEAIREYMHERQIQMGDIQTIKPTLMWAFGEEVGDIVDAVVESLSSRPFTPKPKPATPFPRTSRGWLRDFLANSYTRLAFEALKIVLDMAKLYHRGFAPIIASNLINKGLRYILPPYLYEWYLQVLRGIKQTLVEWSLQIILNVLFSPAQAEHIRTEFVKWQKSVQTILQEAAGTRPIHLVLDSAVPQPAPIKLALHVDWTKDIRHGLLELPEDMQFGKREHLNAANVLHHFNKWMNETKDYPFLPEPIDFEQYGLDLMTKLINQTNGVELSIRKFETQRNPYSSAFYLVDRLELLDIPDGDYMGWWEKIPLDEIPKHLAAMMSVSRRLQHHIHGLYEYLKVHPEYYSRVVCANYNLLCLMARLAERHATPTLIREMYNAYPLLYWLQSKDCKITDPLILQQIHKICRFFFPEYKDLYNLPNLDFLREKEKEKLFYYPKDIRNQWNDFIKESFRPEIQYLDKCLTQTEIIQKCKELNIRFSDGEPIAFSKLSKKWQRWVLFHEFNAINNPNPILPVSYTYSRMQNLFCNRFMYNGFNAQPAIYYFLRPQEYFIPKERYPLLNAIFDFKTLKIIPVQNSRLFCSDHDLDMRLNLEDPYSSFFSDYENSLRRSQSRLISEPSFTHFKELPDPIEKSLFALSRCEQADQLTRLLAFFKQHKEKLFYDYPHLVRHFENTLFHGIDLAKQIEQSPAFARVLGQFFQEICEDFQKSSNWQMLIWAVCIGDELKTYCTDCVPGSVRAFPSYSTIMRNLPIDQISDPQTKASAVKLKAIVELHENHATLSIDELDLIFIKAAFYPIWNSYFKGSHIHIHDVIARKIQSAFIRYHQQRLSDLELYLEDPERCNSIAAELLKDRQLTLTDSSSSWVKEGRWELKKGEISFNLLHGQISGVHYSLDQLIVDLKEATRNCHRRWDELVCFDGKYLATPDHKLKVTFELIDGFHNCQKVKYKTTLEHGGKFYSHCYIKDLPAYTPDWLEEEIKKNLADPTVGICWLEETENTTKGVLIELGKEKEPFLFELKTDSTDPQHCFIDRFNTLISVSKEEIKKALSPLRRFCPLDKIECWREVGSDHINKVKLNQYRLEFVAQKWGEELRLVSQNAFPGFAIATKQMHPHAKGFSCYLLLENQDGKYKLILANEKWIGSIINAFVPFASNFSSFILPWINELETPSMSGHYLSYDLDETGRLTSDSPWATLYLLLLSVLQGNRKRILDCCEQFEMQSKQQAFSADYSKFLAVLCFYPFDLELISLIRRRIFAALEENRLLHPSKDPHKSFDRKEEAKQEELPSHIEDMAIIPVLLMDLQKNMEEQNPRKKVLDAQEWFLFQTIFHRARRLLFSQDLKHLAAYSKKLGESHVFEFLGIAPNLMRRFASLNEKYGQPESWIMKALHLYNRVSEEPAPRFNFGTLFQPDFLRTSSHLTRLGQLVVHSRTYSFEESDLLQLKKEIMFEVFPESAPLEVSKINPRTLRRLFRTYYAIACGECGYEKLRQLEELLPLIKGGWDSQTHLLVNILDSVIKCPRLYPSSKKLADALAYENVKADQEKISERFPLLRSFFSTVQSRMLKVNAGVEAATFVAKGYVNNTLALANSGGVAQISDVAIDGQGLESVSNFNRQMPRSNFSWMSRMGINWGARVLRAAYRDYSRSSISAILPPPQAIARAVYRPLGEEDRQVDNLLTSIYQYLFEETILEDLAQEKKVSSFDIDPSDSEALRDRLTRVNKSITAFYDQPHRKVELTLKHPEALWGAYTKLAKYYSGMHARWIKEQELLLSTINRALPHGQGIDLKILQKGLVQGDFRSLSQELHIPASIMQHLELAMARHYMKKGRLNQLKRLLNHFEELAKYPLSSKPVKFQEKVELIARECQAKRAYSFTDPSLPLDIIRRLLAFEAGANVLLWDKQICRIRDLLIQGKKNAAIELIMSLGKTFFVGPTADSVEANGKQIVVHVAPKPVEETVACQGTSQSKQVYNQDSCIFHFDRSFPISTERLMAIMVMFVRTQEQREVIHATKEDFQALELRFLELLFYRAFPKYQAKKTSEEDILQFRDILEKLSKEGKIIGDEPQDLFYLRQELNYPLGPVQIIPDYLHEAMADYLRILIGDEKFSQLLKDNALENLYLDGHFERLQNLLAKKMSTHPLFQLYEIQECQDFVQFVMGKVKGVPESLSKHPKLQEIHLVKGVIGVLLKLVTKPAHVKFGDAGQDYARPFEGNMSPVMDASIQDSLEALFKTFILILQRGLTKDQVGKWVDKLIHMAEEQSKVQRIPFRETKAYQLFSNIFPHDDLMKVRINYQTCTQEFYQKAAHHTEAIFAFISQFVFRKIQTWQLGLNSNGQNFFSMFGSGYFYTGTPYNDGTYPDLEMLWDPDTTGRALHIMTNKCPEDGIHVLENSLPKPILEEILNHYFTLDSHFTALIDGGALLKGLSNREVANSMLKYCQEHRPDIKAVVFFQKNSDGRDELVYLEKGVFSTKPFDQCPYPPSAYLSYFDDCHGFAANIPQMENGKGLKLVGDTRLFKEMQNWFRMRGLKNDKQVLPVSPELSADKATQQIHVAMTKETQLKISGDRAPTLLEILKFAIVQEANEAAQENYESYRQKVQNVIRKAVLQKIYSCKSVPQMCKLFVEFVDIFVKKVFSDPIKLYGWFEDFISTKDALKIFRENAFAVMKKSKAFTDQEKTDIWDHIMKVPTPVMPKEVTIYLDGKEVRLDALDQVGKEVTHEHHREIDKEVEQRVDFEDQRENNLQDQLGKYKYEEIPWNDSIGTHSTEWQVFEHKPEPLSLSLLLGKVSKPKRIAPPVFKVADVLHQSPSSALADIYQAFDSRLWFSNNFIPQVVSSFAESKVQIGTKQQRDLCEVLIDLVEKEDGSYGILSFGCLSIKDAVFWREKLYNLFEDNPAKIKRVLYDTTLRTVVAGDFINHEKLIKSSELQTLEVQAKFLNGDTRYENCQMDSLRQWIQNFDPNKIRQAFDWIYNQRQKQPYFCSAIEKIFADVIRF